MTLIANAIADSIEVARKEVPEDERRRVDELEATTYSTETGETTEREKPQRRRPRRKRRPKPEVIAQHIKEDGVEGTEQSDEEIKDEETEGPVAEVKETEGPEVEGEESAEG